MPRRGENIYKRKDGRWEGRFKPDSSSQKYKSVYAPTYKLAKEKLIELKMNKHFESDKIILMCELCKEWLEFKKEDIKESTYIKYRNIILNHINPDIGNAYINRLQSEDMQKYILSLKIGGLSNKSVHDILSVVSAIFKYAENKGFNTNNLYYDIKTLSEILGHSNVSTTLNLYAHPTLEHKRANMNKLVPFE